MIKKTSFWVLILLFSACSSNDKKSEEKQGGSMKVEVFNATTSTIPLKIDVPGTVLAAEEVSIYSEVSGRIKQILFEEGKRVSKGQLLVQVDVDILLAQRNKLSVDLDLAKKDEARKKKLFSAKAISEEEYEKSQASLQSIEAQIQLMNVQISKAQIRAPFSGKIGLRHVSEGAYISPQTLITSILQDDEIKIEFSIAEKYASRVKIGQKINFSVQHDSSLIEGTLYAFQPYINADSRMLTLRAKLKNKYGILPGSFVSVNYDLGSESNAFMVPAECVVPVLNGQKIWVLRNGKAHELSVDLGIRTADKVQILGDIHEGGLILTSGLLAVKEGMPLDIKK